MNLEFHEAANLFPLMEGKDFADLKADIEANGLKEKPWTWEGKILDGRNRYNASKALGFDPPTREWDGKGSPVAFVASMNLHRRHLSVAQRSMIAAKIATTRWGDSTRMTESTKGSKEPLGINNGEAAKMMGVARMSVKRARTVRERGVPSLTAAVESGKISLNKAADVAVLPEPEQHRAVADLLTKPPPARRKARKPKTKPTDAASSNGDGSDPVSHVRHLLDEVHTVVQRPISQISSIDLRSKVSALRQAFDALHPRQEAQRD